FGLFDATTVPMPRRPVWHGKVEGITGPSPSLSESGQDTLELPPGAERPYHQALDRIGERVRVALAGRRLPAVAHRVVHGGTRYERPVLVDAAVLADLRSYIPLAPLHQPFALDAIEALLAQQPALPQVACFDTAFHHTLPDVERMLPLPWDAWERGI